jgi:Na+-driven multidrug efflux pump
MTLDTNHPPPPSISSSIALPAVAGLVIDPFLSLVDTGYVARLGTRSLAACGPCTSVFHFTWAIPRALTLSTVTLVASSIASRNAKIVSELGDERDIARVSIVLAVLLGLLTSSIVISFGPTLLSILGGASVGSTINKMALPYLNVRALAAVAVTVLASTEGICRSSRPSTFLYHP